MATVYAIFLLNPTYNSVLSEHVPGLELVQVQTAGDHEVGQVSGATWAVVPPLQGEHSWGGGTGQGQQLQQPTLCVYVQTTSKLQVGEAGKWKIEELWKWLSLRCGWGSGWGVAAAGVWNEKSKLPHIWCGKRGSPGSHSPPGSATSDSTVVNLFSDLRRSSPVSQEHRVVSYLTFQPCWLQWLDAVTLLLFPLVKQQWA